MCGRRGEDVLVIGEGLRRERNVSIGCERLIWLSSAFCGRFLEIYHSAKEFVGRVSVHAVCPCAADVVKTFWSLVKVCAVREMSVLAAKGSFGSAVHFAGDSLRFLTAQKSLLEE